MAVTFASASSESYYRSASFSGDVFSMAAWVYLDSTASDQAIISCGDEGSAGTNYYRLRYGTAGSFQCTHDDGTGSTAFSTLTPSTGVWYHVCCAFAALGGTDARTVWTDGGNAGSSTSTRTSISSILDNVSIGGRRTSTTDQYLSGRVMWATVWQGYALVEADAAALAGGLPPWFIHPESIVSFTPLYSADGTPRDWMTGGAYTTTGTPTTSEGPHVHSAGAIYPMFTPGGISLIVPTGPLR